MWLSSRSTLEKMGLSLHDPSTRYSQNGGGGGGGRGGFSVGAIVFVLPSPRKAIKESPWSFKRNYAFIVVHHSNNSYNKRLSFDASKTGDCKPTRLTREGCGSTESVVCSFVLGTYSQRGSAPPPLWPRFTDPTPLSSRPTYPVSVVSLRSEMGVD